MIWNLCLKTNLNKFTLYRKFYQISNIPSRPKMTYTPEGEVVVEGVDQKRTSAEGGLGFQRKMLTFAKFMTLIGNYQLHFKKVNSKNNAWHQ